MQDFKLYKELHWEGSFGGLPRDHSRQAAGDAQRVPAPLRHDHQLRHRRVHRQQEEARSLQLLQGRAQRRRQRDLRARHPAHAARPRAPRGVRGLRPRAARHSPPRAGLGFVEEHHRAPLEAGRRRVFAHAGRRALHVRVVEPRGHRHREPRGRPVPQRDERRAAPRHPRRVAGEGDRAARALERQVQGPRRRRHGPRQPLHLQGADAALRGRLGEDGRQPHSREAPRLERERPRRHRHLPAQGREG